MRIDLYVITSKSTSDRSALVEDFVSALKRSHDVAVTNITEHDEVSNQQLRENVTIEKINNVLFDSQLRSLAPRHVSNALKHLEALKLIASSTRIGATPIVVEDDPVVNPDTVAADVEYCISNAPSSWQVVMLGLPGRVDGPQPMQEVYRALPLCNAYAIRSTVAAKVSATFLPIRYVTNVHLSYLFEAFDVHVTLMSPAAITDGSKEGSAISKLVATNELSFNPQYMRAKKALEEGNVEAASEEIRSSKYATHPDFMYLSALVELKSKGKQAALPKFRETMEAYEQAGTVLNNESKFLSDYIDLYKPE